LLKRSSLNLGSVFFDSGVKDTANAKIYKQIPAPGDDEIKSGDEINVYLH
jgi:hypothetical protein